MDQPPIEVVAEVVAEAAEAEQPAFRFRPELRGRSDSPSADDSPSEVTPAGSSPSTSDGASPAGACNREQVSIKPSGGNLFLTCLRLRFEQYGSWEEALREKDDGAETAGEDAANATTEDAQSVSTAGAGDAGTASSNSADAAGRAVEKGKRLSWKEWAGRDDGNDKYQVGDIVRGGFRHLFKKKGALSVGPTFGLVGTNVVVEHAEGGVQAAVASRPSDVLENGIAVTDSPLECKTWDEDGIVVSQYYFEFKVLEAVPSSLALMLGFVWHPDVRDCPDDKEFAECETLPASARELSHAFVAGGDPSRWYLGGKECGPNRGKIGAWRPLMCVASQNVLGALLEVRQPSDEASSPTLRFTVYQDGILRASVQVELDHCEDTAQLSTAPHGLIDIGGNVRKVQLLPTSSLARSSKDMPRRRSV